MVYIKQDWNSGDLLTADKMNHIESGIEVSSNKVDSIESKMKGYIHTQVVPSAIWTIKHGLDKYPSTTILDSSGNLVLGDTKYIDNNNIELHFSCEFAGTVIIN